MNDTLEQMIQAMADDLVAVDGVVGVVLGGSRARGMQQPGSDVDLGVMVHGRADIAALTTLASRWSSAPTTFAEPGDWGPWVDSGAWLTVDGTAVDWIRRDLDRIDAQWERALRGEYTFHEQPGHPLGFLDVAYCGELVHARILRDPLDALESRRAPMQTMPDALGEALAERLWESEFLVTGALKAAGRGDAAYVALALARAVLLAMHALHGRDRAWATNEKGLVRAASRLPHAPAELEEMARAALGTGAGDAAGLRSAVAATEALVAAVRTAL